MIRILMFCLVALGLAGAHRAAAHDMPAEVSITGYFDAGGGQPELMLRMPLILLANQNMPKRGPGYLDLANLDEAMGFAEQAAVSAFQIGVDGTVLTPEEVVSRISLPSEATFDTVEDAREGILGAKLPVETNVFWNQGFFDVLMRLDTDGVPGIGDDSRFDLHLDLPPGMAGRTHVTIGVAAAGEDTRFMTIAGDTTTIALDPAWYDAGRVFLVKGVEHILIGTDHLLFLLCLVLPLRRDPRRLLGVVTAFTLGHSVTLIPAAMGFAPDAAWFLPAVETMIAVSIVYMAIENVLGVGAGFRWKLAFGFGLIHGFGFASTLTDVIPFAGAHILASLVFFNIGIELGQILSLVVIVSVLAILLGRWDVERGGIIVISVLAGHEAWHWAVERFQSVPFELATGGNVYGYLTWVALILTPLVVIWAFRRRGDRQPVEHPAE